MTLTAIILFAALADRMRGGFPERRFWGRDIVRMAAWYASGALVAMLIRPDWWCLLAGVLYAQGDRQDMSVMAELIRPDGRRLKGWLGQLRIGAVFAACVAPMLAVDLAYWPMVVAAGVAPALGAIAAQGVQVSSRWAWMEVGRGAAVAGLVALLAR